MCLGHSRACFVWWISRAIVRARRNGLKIKTNTRAEYTRKKNTHAQPPSNKLSSCARTKVTKHTSHPNTHHPYPKWCVAYNIVDGRVRARIFICFYSAGVCVGLVLLLRQTPTFQAAAERSHWLRETEMSAHSTAHSSTACVHLFRLAGGGARPALVRFVCVTPTAM